MIDQEGQEEAEQRGLGEQEEAVVEEREIAELRQVGLAVPHQRMHKNSQNPV